MHIDTERADKTRIADGATVTVHATDDRPLWRAHATVEKFSPDQASWLMGKLGRRVRPQRADFSRHGISPDEVAEAAHNLITTAGLTRITSLIIAGGGQGATNTATRIGAGNGSTAAAVGDTDLSAAAGSSNRWFQVMDATYPQAAAGVITVRGTFASADGNFAWNEWGIDIGTPTVSSGNTVAATLLNRKVASLGTKVSGAVWTLTATLTLS